MVDKTTVPAYNPANGTSEAGKDIILIKNIKKGLFCAAPAIVESFDRTKQRATIRPALMAKKSNGESIAQDFIYNVPVRFGGGGGFAVNLPLAKGDTGWLIFCDRDISAFKSTRQVMPCNTNRMHAPEDAFFLPDAMQSAQVSAEDSGKAVFQTLDGSNKIAIGTDDITIKTKNLNITADSVSFTSPVITTTGAITATGDVIAAGISASTHVHGGVSSGPSTTGGPQ
ncbi:MAG: hypothetical protein IKB61_02670 [Elusimicrobiaceae bacterium]|nr:hypothetical protein [Elusimicrobiaceae bacterium]MBR4355112.1 hypothetical protein [Elusimicrobiaceae bacterium]